MNELRERLNREYLGKELREFLLHETADTINDRPVCICVGDMWKVLIFSSDFITLLHLGSEVKSSLIDDITADDMDITIVIKNPFKGAD